MAIGEHSYQDVSTDHCSNFPESVANLDLHFPRTTDMEFNITNEATLQTTPCTLGAGTGLDKTQSVNYGTQ